MDMTNLNSLLERAQMAIEDKEWEDAARLIDRALDVDYKSAKAYILKYLISQKVSDPSRLLCSRADLEEDGNIKKALRFAEGEDKQMLDLMFAESEQLEKKSSDSFIQNRRLHEIANRMHPYLLLNADGTVDTRLILFKKANDWSNIISIRVYNDTLIGIRSDGGVMYCGDPCIRGIQEITTWTDIVKIEVADSWLVGLDRHGRLHICGDDFSEDFDCMEVESWTGIVDVGIGIGGEGIYAITEGGKVKKSGTLFFLPGTSHVRQDESPIERWENIHSISIGADFALGLCKDGKVVACGNNDVGQCNVRDWKNIIQLYTSFSYSAGLRTDGTVLVCGSNADIEEQCADLSYLNSWDNIVYFSLSPNGKKAVGVRRDGSVSHFGFDRNPDAWTNVASATVCDDEIFAVTNDGYLLTTSSFSDDDITLGRSFYLNARLFNDVDHIEREFEQNAPAMEERLLERRRIRADQERLGKIYIRRRKGVCQHCGKPLKGTWMLTCSSCKKKLDYPLYGTAKASVIKARVKQITTLLLTVILIATVIFLVKKFPSMIQNLSESFDDFDKKEQTYDSAYTDTTDSEWFETNDP